MTRPLLALSVLASILAACSGSRLTPDEQRQLNAAMERLIRRFPAQYLWGYNRYKAPSGVAAASRPEAPR